MQYFSFETKTLHPPLSQFLGETFIARKIIQSLDLGVDFFGHYGISYITSLYALVSSKILLKECHFGDFSITFHHLNIYGKI